ncbi:hypothetical protein P9H32_10905 [Pontiella sp. NLcol2]|uniref:Uncharacterized protein n=1 Tax=Pontiella agarivorans TaxID=3038953 RepID=A0ABU5MY63_9BACT|nr:hypothetical protein [Pontiella agarivorans]MDZ8119134.1 hypothetical protein [Pontiella agarivorans]
MYKTILLAAALQASLFAFSSEVQPELSGVLIEAESFAEKGGWVVDQQFIDTMGSPYLLAHGMGNPTLMIFRSVASISGILKT